MKSVISYILILLSFLSCGDEYEDIASQILPETEEVSLEILVDRSDVEIFSSGHRNPQGLTTHPTTGVLYSSEHGPVGGDELNIITQGSNYGWPLVTQGRSAPGFVDPIIHWSPAIAPSGIIFYTGNQIPQWQGNLFIATLRGEHIRRLVVSGDKVLEEELIFENFGIRFRTLRTGPDGFLYVSTDDGRIGKITPVQ